MRLFTKDVPRWAGPALVAFIIALFLVRNLPWHLDDFDQAKQAFTSYEMLGEGHWWFQHTPTGRIATKPPLVGWTSASLFLLMRSWDLAWRLPSLLCALGMLWILWKAGGRVGTEPLLGSLVAAGSFGLNLWVPRISTLVRTDMVLAFLIFVIGYLIHEKLRLREPWTTRDRCLLAVVLLASMMTKGPIAYAFLIPGILTYWWVARGTTLPRAWCGWWPWILPLSGFLIWAGIGTTLSPEFYEQVVQREFLGRFTAGENAVHGVHPFPYYCVQILHKWLPWSGLLIALLSTRQFWRELKIEPATLWLVCWAFAGLAFMSAIPSKRSDRILPVIPPLCLLLATIAAARPDRVLFGRWPVRQTILPVLLFGVVFSGGYGFFRAARSFATDQGGLVQFGERVRERVKGSEDRFAVVNGKDEGMVIYVGRPQFTDLDDAADAWKLGSLDWLVVSERVLQEEPDAFTPYDRVLESGRIPKKGAAYVLIRPQAP